MKVTDLRRKLLAALAAGGMLSPSAMYAADLNQNLVVNGGFENVDLNTTGSYRAPLILDWTPSIPISAGIGTTAGFAYCHSGTCTSSAGTVPNYADGTPPPSSGQWYFTSNRQPVSGVNYINLPGEFYQDINVSTGNSAALIATGLARFEMSAQMSSYLDDADYGNVHAEFRNGSGGVLGSAVISDLADDGPNNVWNLTTGIDSIPVGTASVRLSIFGTKDNGIGAGPDGYIDNVEFKVKELTELALVVDRSNGNLSIKNLTNTSVPISGYSITSDFEGMAPANWTAITTHYDSGNPGMNQVDSLHAWSKLTNPSTHTDLSEADLQTGVGAALPNTRSVNLGNGAWIRTPYEDLVFQYVSNGEVVEGVVSYINNDGSPYIVGDFDLDNEIDVGDWIILRNNQLADLSTKSLAEAYRLGDLTADKSNDHADFIQFKSLFDSANGSGSFFAMLAAIPEPSSSLLVMAAGMFILPALRRRPNR